MHCYETLIPKGRMESKSKMRMYDAPVWNFNRIYNITPPSICVHLESQPPTWTLTKFRNDGLDLYVLETSDFKCWKPHTSAPEVLDFKKRIKDLFGCITIRESPCQVSRRGRGNRAGKGKDQAETYNFSITKRDESLYMNIWTRREKNSEMRK